MSQKCSPGVINNAGRCRFLSETSHPSVLRCYLMTLRAFLVELVLSFFLAVFLFGLQSVFFVSGSIFITLSLFCLHCIFFVPGSIFITLAMFF